MTTHRHKKQKHALTDADRQTDQPRLSHSQTSLPPLISLTISSLDAIAIAPSFASVSLMHVSLSLSRLTLTQERVHTRKRQRKTIIIARRAFARHKGTTVYFLPLALAYTMASMHVSSCSNSRNIKENRPLSGHFQAPASATNAFTSRRCVRGYTCVHAYANKMSGWGDRDGGREGRRKDINKKQYNVRQQQQQQQLNAHDAK